MPKLFRSYCRADSHDSTSFKKDEDMGLGPNWGRDDGFSSAPYVAAEVQKTRIPKVQQLNPVEGNPNPKNFRILQSERIGRFVILLVNLIAITSKVTRFLSLKVCLWMNYSL
jgi:hypothetical protein